MKKDTRLDYIVKLCKNQDNVTISYLAGKLNVSEITIRRDLKLLENLKLIKKERKRVYALESPSINHFINYNIVNEYQKAVNLKKRIGKKAASLIEPGETVFFDSGSTLFYMVKELPDSVPIKAICYGLEIAGILNNKKLIQLVVLGGIYHKETDMFESLSEEEELRNIRAQKAFISAFGIHRQAGLTSGSFFASFIRKKIIQASEKVICLADSSKFGIIECAHFAELKDIHLFITDSGIKNEYVELLKSLGIEIIVV